MDPPPQYNEAVEESTDKLDRLGLCSDDNEEMEMLIIGLVSIDTFRQDITER